MLHLLGVLMVVVDPPLEEQAATAVEEHRVGRDERPEGAGDLLGFVVEVRERYPLSRARRSIDSKRSSGYAWASFELMSTNWTPFGP